MKRLFLQKLVTYIMSFIYCTEIRQMVDNESPKFSRAQNSELYTLLLRMIDNFTGYDKAELL